MHGSQVTTDLHLDTVHTFLDLQSTWGKTQFTEGLHTCTSDSTLLKRQQLPLLALTSAPSLCDTVRKELANINTTVIDDCLEEKDSRIAESVSQVLWKPSTFGSFLNSSPFVLNCLITWKTILLPGFAILMPLLAIVVPFFVLRFLHPTHSLPVSDYLVHLRGVLLQQITIPVFLKSQHDTDRVGFMLESLFIGITLIMFISGIWNQIVASLHLRTIWSDLAERGDELQNLLAVASKILGTFTTASRSVQRALRYVIEEGESAMRDCKHLEGLSSVSTFGTVWNANACIVKLRNWLGKIDVLTSIAHQNDICFPKISSGSGKIHLTGVYHPELTPCVTNDFTSSGHTIVTGPNRGGKSTFCKAVGLSIVTAQSWGFAWAKQMTYSPFAHILTALEPCGKLGIASTFEAEIEFAKTVLATDTQNGPIFVMMDEIFHSTNATDGLAASTVFLQRLYDKGHTLSIISTHYRNLAETFSKRANALHLVTTETETGKLLYTYKVAHGVSDKSSVMEILAERGLTPVVAAAVAVNATE